jgi:hypothetical protein
MQFTSSPDLANLIVPSGMGQFKLICILLGLFAGIAVTFILDTILSKKINGIRKSSWMAWFLAVACLTAILYFGGLLCRLPSQGWELSSLGSGLAFISVKICPLLWLFSIIVFLCKFAGIFFRKK